MYENAIRNMDSNEAYEIVFHSVNKFILLLGFLSGSEDHYTHSISWTMKDGTSHSGYDFYENERPAYEYKDQYSTNIFSHRTIDIIEQHNFSKVGKMGNSFEQFYSLFHSWLKMAAILNFKKRAIAYRLHYI